MKTKLSSHFCGLAVLAGAAALPSLAAHWDIFVTNFLSNSIGAYTNSGGTINTALVSGLAGPVGIEIAGSDMFVTNYGNDTLGEHTTLGATVNTALISGLSNPGGIAVSGSDLFVINEPGNTIGEYTTSGATVNATLVSGLAGPVGIAISGSDMFVTNYTLLGAKWYIVKGWIWFRKADFTNKSHVDLYHCSPRAVYYYVITQTYPFIPRYFRGTPDRSFYKHLPRTGRRTGGGRGGFRPGGGGGRGPGGFGPGGFDGGTPQ